MEGVEALVSAAALTPPHSAGLLPPPALPPVRHEVVDPADKEAVAWLCGLLHTGQADLYGQDEADLALLPTLARTWMRRGEQLKVPAPGTNRKCSVSATIDLGEGWLWWFDHPKRSAVQFGVTLFACANRSERRGRLAVVLVDNAPSHQVGKTGIVRRFLNAMAGRVVLVFQPKYSPEAQPTERLWRQWRPNVTHNHTRGVLEELLDDSDAWLARTAAHPAGILQLLGLAVERLPFSMAA
jgi:DDE superfamily endonuclease